jgi:hypothetical protein
MRSSTRSAPASSIASLRRVVPTAIRLRRVREESDARSRRVEGVLLVLVTVAFPLLLVLSMGLQLATMYGRILATLGIDG